MRCTDFVILQRPLAALYRRARHPRTTHTHTHTHTHGDEIIEECMTTKIVNGRARAPCRQTMRVALNEVVTEYPHNVRERERTSSG